MDEDEGRVTDLCFIARAAVLGVGANLHRNRGGARFRDIAIDDYLVPDMHGSDELETLDRHRNDAATSTALRHGTCGQVHLRHEPAAEDIPIGIGIGGHGGENARGHTRASLVSIHALFMFLYYSGVNLNT